MKQTILLAALGLTALGAAAQEVGNVISSQPVVQQVAVPRQVCTNQPVYAPQQTSGGGGLLGAIIGGALGNGIGGGAGHAAAIGLGAVAGAVVGNNIEANNNAMAGGQMAQQCTTQNTYENRTVAWNVTYEYAGRQYTVQMPYDPGPTVRLQVSAVGASDGNTMVQGQVVTAPPVQSAAAPVYIGQQPPAQVVYSGYPYPYPAYPVYRPYYPPISLSFGYVWGGGGGHRHWR